MPQLPENNEEGMRNPSEQNIAYEEVKIYTKDQIKLSGWLLFQKEKRNVPTIIFFHENAGNIGVRLPYLNSYYKKLGVNILIVAYRGFSNSEGEPSEAGIQLDSIAILDYAFNHEYINNKQIFIHGRSLGGAVAVYVATHTKYQIAGVILENTFTSISDMVDVTFKYLSCFKRLILRNYWPSINLIHQIKQPILFIFALKDEIVPYQQMAKLYAKAETAKFKEKYVVAEGDHNTSWQVDENAYFNSINKFLMKILSQ